MTARATASATTSEGRTALLTVIAAVVILLTREPATLLAPQLWAEVGTIFASDVLMGRDVGLFAPYAGYFQLVPRAISAVIVPITPLELLPLALNVAAVLVSGLAVYLVATARVPVAHRWLYALAMVLVPHGGEVWAATTNLHWIGSVVLLTLVLQKPAASWRDALRDTAIAFACGFSSPFALPILPLLAVRYIFVERPSRYDWPALIMMIAATVATVACIVVSDRGASGSFASTPLLSIAAIPVLAVSAWIGGIIHLQTAPAINLVAGMIFGVAILTVMTIPTVRLLRSRGTEGLGVLAVLAFAGAILTMSAIRIPWDIAMLMQARGDGERYLYVPHVMWLWGLIYLVTTADGRVRQAAAVVLAAVALTVAPQFGALRYTDYHWTEQAAGVGSAPTRLKFPPGWDADFCRSPCASTPPAE
jgi:hypothetical protein